MIIFHLLYFLCLCFLPASFFLLVKLANGLLVNGLWFVTVSSLSYHCFVFLLNTSIISLCFKTCGKMFYCNFHMPPWQYFLVNAPHLPYFCCSFPHPLPDIISCEWILFWFIFDFPSVKQVNFSRSRFCWRPMWERHQGLFQVWKFFLRSLVSLPLLYPLISSLFPSPAFFLPSCFPPFLSHCHRDRLFPTNLVCLFYLSFSSSFSAFWSKRSDLVIVCVCCVSCFWQMISVLYLNVCLSILCVNLTGPWGAQVFGQTLFGVFLWMFVDEINF